jgi:hypothetical protein
MILGFGPGWWLTGPLLVVALVVGIAAIVAVAQNAELSGSEKAIWVIAIVLFPLFGGVVYFAVRREW